MATETRSLAADLRRLLPAKQVFDGVEDRTLYAYDGTSIKALPDVIAQVRSPAEVSAVLRFASDHEVPVVPRGAGTGLSGGSVPAQGGIALVLAGMRAHQGAGYRQHGRRGGAGRHYGRLPEDGGGCRDVLSAGSCQPELLHAGRQYRRERGRSARGEVRGDQGLRPGAGSGGAQWGRGAPRREADQERDRVQPGPALRRIRGDAGRDHRGHAAPPAEAAGQEGDAGHLRPVGRRGRGGGGDHGGRRDPVHAGDHGPEEHQLRGGLPEAGACRGTPRPSCSSKWTGCRRPWRPRPR